MSQLQTSAEKPQQRQVKDSYYDRRPSSAKLASGDPTGPGPGPCPVVSLASELPSSGASSTIPLHPRLPRQVHASWAKPHPATLLPLLIPQPAIRPYGHMGALLPWLLLLDFERLPFCVGFSQSEEILTG